MPPWPLQGRQQAVAEALEREDRAAPAHAVVLLGDNFYPDGLGEGEFKKRLRENLVSPYCRFVRLTTRGLGSMEEACATEPSPMAEVRILAVLGNHDHKLAESPRLQARRIPEYLANWSMPREQASLVELPGGVSLVLLHSQPIASQERSAAVLAEKLRRARGSWRVVAAHHPIVDPGRGYDARYAEQVRSVMAAAHAPVHLFLAGHEHNLQVLPGDAPLPPLHVISGAGSDVRQISETEAPRSFALASLGFVRLDAWEGDERRLEVTVYAVSSPRLRGLVGGGQARVVSRWSVTSDGETHELPLEGPPSTAPVGLPAPVVW